MKYELEKYRNKNQKHECPNCGKRTFVRYVGEDGSYLHSSVGKCDRADECAYHYTPKEYFQDNPSDDWTPKKVRYKREVVTPIDYLDIDRLLFPLTGKGNGLKNDFTTYLYNTYPERKIQIDTTLWSFLCGDYGDDILFPYIDKNGRYCTGKIMKYDKSTGKRRKDEPYCIDWVHSKLIRNEQLKEDFHHRLCLFGESQLQLSSAKDKPIAIVESEKTAIIASLFIDDFVWLASGALGWLNVAKLEPIRDKRIVLFPDTSETGTAFERWSKVAASADEKGFSIAVDRTLEDTCTPEEKKRGYDIADLITRI